MALASAVGAASFDRTASTFQLDLSTELAEVIRPDNTAFLDRVGSASMVAKQRIHYWDEDALNSYISSSIDTADGILTASGADTNLVVASAEGLKFKEGTLFKDQASGKSEVMQVVTISTDSLTIVREYGSTSVETHGSGTTGFDIQIIAHTKQEGWKPTQEDWTKERTSQYNRLQIFGRGITLARERQLVDQTVIASELAHQSAYRLKEIARELNGSLINGIRSAAADSDAVYGSFGGLIEFASQSTGNITTTTEELTENVVNTMAKQIWDDAGQMNNGFILVGGGLKRVIATFDQAYRRSDFNTKAAGFTVEKFLTDLGYELDVIVDPQMPADVMVIGDLSKIKCGPLQGDSMSLEELAKTGRVHEWMVSGGMTAEFRNAIETTAHHSNLS
jgi:hypothetical protein